MKLSASKIDLARRCLWPFRRDAGPQNASGFAAAAGHDEHGYIEHTLKTGDITPKSETHQRWLSEWYEEHGHIKWQVEQPIAIIPSTGETRMGPQGWNHRDYSWSTWDHLVGTVDAWTVENGRLRIVDWKTGQAAHIHSPTKAGQMLFLGLAFARHLRSQGQRVDEVSLEYVLVNDSRLWIESGVATRSDLLAFHGELTELMEGADGDPQPVRGHWCKSMWCGYLGRCPATAGALTTLAPDTTHPIALRPEDIASDEHAAWQYRLLQAAAKSLEEGMAAIKERAKVTPIPLEDGMIYGPREKTRETVQIEVDGARDVLFKHLGNGAKQAIITKHSATKTSIKDAARLVAGARTAQGQKTTIKALETPILADLHALGAIKVSTYSELEEYSPKEPQASEA